MQKWVNMSQNPLLHPLLNLFSGTFRNPQPLVFSQEEYCRYKWEAYCGTNWRCIVAFPFSSRLRSQRGRALQRRVVLQYTLEVYCQYFRREVYTKVVLSSENSGASTGKKEVWCIPKSLFSRERRKNPYTPKSLPGL